MENFIAKKTEIIETTTGTNALPLLVDILPGKGGRGYSIVTKIDSMYYSNLKNRMNKNNSCSTRCKNYREKDGNCSWSGKISNISEFSQDSPEFWKAENWIVVPNYNALLHTCSGTNFNQISSLQMRNFVKSKYDEGITDLKIIKNLSGLKNDFADHAAELIGDDGNYQRIIQRKRKRKNPAAVIPPELEKMKTWNPITNSIFDEQFLHRKTFDYFYLPEFIHLLSGNISLDGTFDPCKHVVGIKQLFCINIQMYDHANSKTHIQPILIAALPDKKTETYDTFFKKLKEIYTEITGNLLFPSKLHSDNESAIINNFKSHFPQTPIVTCLFHIKNSLKKYLIKIGLKNKSPKFEELFNTLQGLLFCDLNCPIQYNFSLQLVTCLEECSTEYLNEFDSEKFKISTAYFRTYYLTPNHIYFLGAISNFQLDLLTELTPQLTNNPCESLNAILQNKYNLGHINLSSMVSGIYNFFSERRDKFRIFNAGLKVAKRKRSDLNHFIKLQFIARNLKSAIRESTFNYIFIQDIFYEAVFKFNS